MFEYLAPPTRRLAEYGQQLLSRAAEARVVLAKQVSIAGWEPKSRQCHSNASIDAHQNRGFKAIRGWLHIPLDGLYFTRFLAHSIVEDEQGNRFDITPSQASQPYAFIDSNLCEDEYFDVESELIEAHGISILDIER